MLKHLTKLALIVEYDGFRYHGFQLQPASPTVQEVLEQAALAFTGRPARVDCASRTDAGVHAEAQVVSLRTDSPHAPGVWVGALNYYLPDDVAVLAAYQVPDDYNVRTAATGRRYRYSILNRSTRSPLSRHRAFWVPKPLDLDAMNEAAAHLLGERDFGPFCGPMKKGVGTVRKLTKVEFRRDGDYVHFWVEGNAFLPQQVRRMTGALVEVGLGKRTLPVFDAKADNGQRGSMGPTLPPYGLTLVEVFYSGFPSGNKAQQHIQDNEDEFESVRLRALSIR